MVVIPLATYVLQKAIFKVSLPQLSLPSAATVMLLLFVLFEIASERGVAAGAAAAAEKQRAAQEDKRAHPAEAWCCAQVGLVAVDRSSLAVLDANPSARRIGTDFEALAETSRQQLRHNVARGAGLLHLKLGQALYEVSVSGCVGEVAYLLLREVPGDLLDRQRRERRRRDRLRRRQLERRQRWDAMQELHQLVLAEVLQPALKLVRHEVLLIVVLGLVKNLYESLKPLRKVTGVQPASLVTRWKRGDRKGISETVLDLQCLQAATCAIELTKKRARVFTPQQREAARCHLRQRGIIYELDNETAARLGVGNEPTCLWQALDCFTDSVDELQDRLNECAELLAAAQDEQLMYRRLGRPLPPLPPRTPALPSPPDQDNQTIS